MDWYIAKLIGLFTGLGMVLQGFLMLLFQGGSALWLMPGIALMCVALFAKRKP